MNFYTIVKYLHSGLRFVVAVLLILAAVNAIIGWLGNKPYTNGNRKLNLFAMISAHTQLLVGLLLYFISPVVQFGANTMKDATTRYWTVEHISMMVFAIILITIGNARSKRATEAAAKHRAIAIFFTLAIIVIIAAIAQSQRPMFGISA